MTTKARTIEVTPGSELARLLDDPAGLPVELVKDGLHYRLDLMEMNEEREAVSLADAPVEEIGWEDYDPERVRQVLDELAGTLSDEEADRWIEEVYRARRIDMELDAGSRSDEL
jgi:hypothetical protein